MKTISEVLMTPRNRRSRSRDVETRHGLARAAAILVAAAVLTVAGCSKQAPPPVNVPPPPDPSATARAAWSDFASSFIESYFKSHPFFAPRAGRHEFDGQMADWSAEGFKTEIERLKGLREK